MAATDIKGSCDDVALFNFNHCAEKRSGSDVTLSGCLPNGWGLPRRSITRRPLSSLHSVWRGTPIQTARVLPHAGCSARLTLSGADAVERATGTKPTSLKPKGRGEVPNSLSLKALGSGRASSLCFSEPKAASEKPPTPSARSGSLLLCCPFTIVEASTNAQ